MIKIIRLPAFLMSVALFLNCLLFAAYRVLFLACCVSPIKLAEGGRMLLYGLRLDVALLGFEFCLIGLVALLFRRLRLHMVFWWLWWLTALHLFSCLANLFSFMERGQNAGDLLLPYITSPYQVYLAVIPFCEKHWLSMLGLGVVAVIWFWFGRRVASRLQSGQPEVDLWSNWKVAIVALLVSAFPLMMTWQPIIKKRKFAAGQGLTVKFASSKFYTHFPDFRENETVINPVLEFIGEQIPTAFHRTLHYRLTENEALERWRKDNRPPTDPEYPLLKVVHGLPGSEIENVIIIQVEGLSGSVLEQERNGRPVTPYLRKLTRSGIYFPNAFQNANFTSGGVFSTASGVPKAAWEETTRRFASHELHGYYGSLAHILGTSNYTHYFFEAFRQSGDDFLSFMAYQGCRVLDYQDFKNRLEAKQQLAGADSILGISDGYFMGECADLLEQCPTRFTAHLMTCTTHSPWSVPASFAAPFEEPAMNTFAYLDASIEALVERIEHNEKLRDRTLVVVTGDHTSVTFGRNLLERLRIPLILYAPGLPRLEGTDSIWASQVDVLPTILGAMSGDHTFAGMGRNLFDDSTSFTGVVSGTRDTGFFVTQDWVLEYHPFGGEPQLFAITNGLASPEDRAEEEPQMLSLLQERCFSRIELARRLGLSKHVFPSSTTALHLAAASVPVDERIPVDAAH